MPRTPNPARRSHRHDTNDDTVVCDFKPFAAAVDDGRRITAQRSPVVRRARRVAVARLVVRALLGGAVASGFAYLGSTTWVANWPVFDDGIAERTVQHALTVFLLAWFAVGPLAELFVERTLHSTNVVVALAIWTAWLVVGPARAISLALFALSALVLVAVGRSFARTLRGAR